MDDRQNLNNVCMCNQGGGHNTQEQTVYSVLGRQLTPQQNTSKFVKFSKFKTHEIISAILYIMQVLDKLDLKCTYMYVHVQYTSDTRYKANALSSRVNKFVSLYKPFNYV